MRKVIIFILNFILVVLLTVLCIVIIISKTLLNEEYIKTSLEKSNFYEELHISIQNEFNTYLAQAGIQNGTLSNVYSISDLKIDVGSTLDALYKNKVVDTSDNTINREITAILKNYTENATAIANTLTDIYNRKVVVSSKYVNALGNKMEVVMSTFKTGAIILFVVFVIILIIMCIAIAKFNLIINRLGILMVSTGLLNIIIKIFVGTKFNNIFLLNTAFSNGLIYIINNIVDKIMGIGIGLAVIGLIFIIFGSYKKIEMEN